MGRLVRDNRKATVIQITTRYQCWGKLLLKVVHYNIALLPEKVTNYVVT